jgi:uncharacterized protein (DUF362 family)
MGKHPIYSRDADVYLETGEDKYEAMAACVRKSGFLDNVAAAHARSSKSKEEFLIALKANIMTGSKREDPSPVYTDPELVEYLFAGLRDEGFTNLAVVESRNVYDYSYTGRDVRSVAEMAGYTGRGYRIVDLSEEREPYNYGSVLGQSTVGHTWRDADYRISFAKNKTHWQCFYTGCLKNVYGCLPEWDKMKHYHGRHREFYECCILIADRFPVHFGFLDAWVSGDGFSGHVRDSDPNLSATIFASENIFALDWVMGEKMAVNPALNYVLQEAMHRWGTIEVRRHGNMTPWHPWHNLRPFTVVAIDAAEEAYWLSRFFSRALASEQDPRFPPTSRFQWLFGILQRISGTLDGLAVKKI